MILIKNFITIISILLAQYRLDQYSIRYRYIVININNNYNNKIKSL